MSFGIYIALRVVLMLKKKSRKFCSLPMTNYCSFDHCRELVCCLKKVNSYKSALNDVSIPNISICIHALKWLSMPLFVLLFVLIVCKSNFVKKK